MEGTKQNLNNDDFQSRNQLSDRETTYSSSDDTTNFDEITLIKDITHAIQSTFHKLMTQAQICNFLIQSKAHYFTKRHETQWKQEVKRILKTDFCAESFVSSYHNSSDDHRDKNVEIVWKIPSTSTDELDFLCFESFEEYD